MKKGKIVLGSLIGISCLMLSGSNALSAKGGLPALVEKNAADIADLKTKIEDLKGLKERVEALEETVAEHESAIAKNKDDIAKNKDDIASNKGDIEANQAEIQALKDRLDALKIPNPQLACVTGMFTAGAMDDPVITNQINVSISDPYKVFTTYDAPDIDDHPWGLLCNDGWINTGCSQRNDGDIDTTNDDLDAAQQDNGCFSDDDEYGELWLYTTCCKVIDK